jgi:hypothetical protein
MKIVGYRLGGQNRHVGGQPRVQRRHHPVRRDPPVGLKVHDLAFGMRAGVGAAGGVDLVVLARDLVQRSLQLGFDCSPSRLLLPAGETRPVVLKHDFDIQLLTLVMGIPPPHPALCATFPAMRGSDQSTNSIITIGAASPRRGPLWMIRV